MAINEKMIPITLLNQVQVDKDSGELLANGTVDFFRDTSRGVRKTVYMLSSSGGAYSYVALPNPITLSASGTFQDSGGNNVAVYLYPYLGTPEENSNTIDLYYINCENSAGTVQWTREAIPNLNDANDPVNEHAGEENMLSNSQWTRYFLPDAATTISITSASNKVYPIAPDWDLVLSGSGTVVVTRTPVSGSLGIITSPAYYLDINLGAGVSSGILRQRLKFNSGIWSNKSISGFFAAKVNSALPNAIEMKYKDSSGDVLNNITIFDAELKTTWDTYANGVALGQSNNTQSGSTAYVDITINLPLTNTTSITSMQVVVAETTLDNDAQAYDARSANREQALMGDYYIPRLEYKQVPSMLVGWDFPLNPSQFGESGTVGTNTAEYIWDQTILKTSVSANVEYSRTTATGGLNLKHTVADQAYALIQYLDNEQAAKFVGTALSVNVNGYTTASTNPAQTTAIQVKIFANASASQFGTLPTTIVDLAANGAATLTGTATTAGWYEISRQNLPTATGNLTALASSGVIATNNDVGLNKWLINTDAEVAAGVLAIAVVVSFIPAASSTNYNTIVDSISVTPGDLPSRPAPKSFAEAIMDVQRYYSKSFDIATAPAQNAGLSSAAFAAQAVATGTPSITAMGIKLPTEMRATPTVTLYNPSAANALVRNVTRSNNWSVSTPAGQSINSFYITGTSSSPSTFGEALAVHWSADARIGI